MASIQSEGALARIAARLDESFADLEANGTCAAAADAFAAFLARPGTLERPSLVLRCRFADGALACETVVDKSGSRWRLAKQFYPFLDQILPRVTGSFDVFVLISDTMYVRAHATAEFVGLLGRVPLLRGDWLEGDPVSSKTLAIPDFTLQDSSYADERAETEEAAARLPFEQRDARIKWRGRLTGPDYPDIDNCERFPRYQLLLQALRHPEIMDARLTHYDNVPATASGAALRRRLDDWFGGVVPELPWAAFGQYNYLVSTDGVASSWRRVASILWTGSVLLMQHRWRQFFYPGLVAWEHYVPLANDLSDIADRYHWLRDNPERAAAIAAAGRAFAQCALTRAAIEDHMVTVLDRCARLPRND